MTTNVFTRRLSLYLIIIAMLVGIAAAAYSQDNSVLKVVPKEALIYLRFANLMDFDEKLADLVDSMNIPNAPNVSVDQLLSKITSVGITSLMDLEDAGFDMGSDACIFWTSLSFDKPSLAVHVRSREAAEEAVLYQMGGTDEQYKGVTYGLMEESSAWVFLEDVFVYSKDKNIITEVIEAHLGENQSILQSEKHKATVRPIRAGDISGYVALDQIVSAVLPLLMMQVDQLKQNLSAQMGQQSQAVASPMNFDPMKILAVEMDMGLWLLQQIRSYALSLELGRDGIWVSDSLKFKPDSPVCDFLNIKPSSLKMVEYLPGNVLVAGGITMDAEATERLYSIMFDMMMPVLLDEIPDAQFADLRKKYEAAIHDTLSCLGDEVAFAVSTKWDKMMPRMVYILDIVDEDKARSTLGNLDYIREISQPFYDEFGMDFSMTEGPTQKYTGVQITSFQMDFRKMMEAVPNADALYPEKAFLWQAFVDDKMIFAMSQSADIIKETIDAMNGRKAGIANSPNFDDIKIHLPGKSNMVMYVSLKGYMGFVMNMMAQMNQGMPTGGMFDSINPDIGLAVTTSLDGDGVSNFTYILVKEIQELVGIGMGLSQMMNSQGRTQ